MDSALRLPYCALEVMWMRFMGLSREEIAEARGCARRTVKNIINTALEENDIHREVDLLREMIKRGLFFETSGGKALPGI